MADDDYSDGADDAIEQDRALNEQFAEFMISAYRKQHSIRAWLVKLGFVRKPDEYDDDDNERMMAYLMFDNTHE